MRDRWIYFRLAKSIIPNVTLLLLSYKYGTFKFALCGLALGTIIDGSQLWNGKVHRVPCSVLSRMAHFIYSKKTVTRVFVQGIADTQEEYIEALATGANWHARWIHVRGIMSFWSTVTFHAATSIVAKAVAVFRLVNLG